MFLGIAIGDALGMPVETMSLEQIAEKYGRMNRYIRPDGHKWFNGREAGTWTDDTQLSLVVAESLIACHGLDMDDMAKRHAQALNEDDLGWGGSTREAVKKLARGIHWSQSGITDNPRRGRGNGVAMKASPIGAFLTAKYGQDAWLQQIEETRRDIRAFAQMTHATSMAVESAYAQIFAISQLLQSSPEEIDWDYFANLPGFGAILSEIQCRGDKHPEKLFDRLNLLVDLDFTKKSNEEIRDLFGGGTCYVYDSLPFSYAFFLRNPHSIETLYDVASAGGDTDTNASMVGALIGALHGEEIFPKNLVRELWRVEEILDVAERFTKTFAIPE